MPKEYEDNRVTDAEVAKRRRDLSKAPSERKVGRWYALRHYSQLQREQNQGYHHGYLRGEGSLHCTCGLVIKESDEFLVLNYPNEELKLEPLVLVSGHRNLPSCEGETVALIVAFVFEKALNDYLWTAFCQRCGVVLRKVRDTEAKAFVEAHNETCKK